MNETSQTRTGDFIPEDAASEPRGDKFVPDVVRGRVFRGLVGGVDALVSILLAAMVAITVIGVLGRAVPAISTPYLDQMLPDMLVWLSLLGGATAIATGEHLGITYFAEIMKPALQQIAEVVVGIALLGFFAAVLYGGFRSVSYQVELGINSPAGYPLWIVQLALPVAGVLCITFIIIRSIGKQHRRKNMVVAEAPNGGVDV